MTTIIYQEHEHQRAEEVARGNFHVFERMTEEFRRPGTSKENSRRR